MLLGKGDKIQTGKANVPLENTGNWPLAPRPASVEANNGFTAMLKVSQSEGDDQLQNLAQPTSKFTMASLNGRQSMREEERQT